MDGKAKGGTFPAEIKPSSLTIPNDDQPWLCQQCIPGFVLQCGCLRDPVTRDPQPQSLTKQVSAGDAPLCDGGFHGTDGGGEDVGLLEDLGQLRTVQGAEGGGIVLLSALVELQHGQLVAPGLGIPVLVLQREEGAARGSAASPTGQGKLHGKTPF